MLLKDSERATVEAAVEALRRASIRTLADPEVSAAEHMAVTDALNGLTTVLATDAGEGLNDATG